MLPLYCPGEDLSREKRQSRSLGRGADPRVLAEIFDDPHEVLAGAILLSGASDPGFRRSKWFASLCNGLDLDPDAWREVLRHKPERKKA